MEELCLQHDRGNLDTPPADPYTKEFCLLSNSCQELIQLLEHHNEREVDQFISKTVPHRKQFHVLGLGRDYENVASTWQDNMDYIFSL